MIAIPSGVSIFLCTTATDMRKSFDGLTGLVRSEFSREPNDGSLFLFINRRRDHAELQKKIAVVQQQANLLEQKDALLSEQSTTIRKQEEKLAAMQLEINRLIQQAFGRRSERYLESPQQLKIDFGGGSEVTDAADGLQQAVDDKQLADGGTLELPLRTSFNCLSDSTEWRD